MAKRPTQTNTPSQPTNPSQNVIGATARHDVYEKGLGNRPDLGSEYWGNTEFAEGAVGIPMSPVLNSFRTLTIGDKSVPLSNAVGQTFDTQYGKLTVTGYDTRTGALSYRYELTTNVYDQPNATESDLVTIRVQNYKGGATECLVQFDIIDDTPDARNDTDTVKSGTWVEKGNVISGDGTNEGLSGAGADTKGADGARVTHIVSKTNTEKSVSSNGETEIKGEYGTLKIKADGSYTYTRDYNTKGGVEDVFTYTLTDGDTDADKATLTIKIDDFTPVLTLTDVNVAVDEDDLSNGSDTSKESVAVSKSFSFTSWDGVSSLTVQLDNGTEVEVFKNGAFQSNKEIVTPHGTLKFTGGTWDPANGKGTVSYTYTLTDDLDHTNGNGENTFVENYTVKLKDVDGDAAAQQTFTVTITDDVPDAKNDTDTVKSGTWVEKGNVITGEGTNEGLNGAGADVKGADDAAVALIESATVAAKAVSSSGETDIAGQYGTLKIKADGSYTYTRDYNTKGGVEDVFTYTLKDGDGDTDAAKLTIKIDDFTPVLTLTGADVAVDEDDLSNGSDTSKESVAVSKSFSFTSWDGVSSLTVQLDNGTEVEVFKNGAFQSNKEIVTPHGTLKFTGGNYDAPNGTGTVNYTYTLTDNLPHADAGGENTLIENYIVKLTDIDGDPATQQTFTVTITDDVPDAKDDTDTVKVGTQSETGNVITGVGTNEGPGGLGTDVKGADGATVTQIESVKGGTKAVSTAGTTEIAGQYGKLKIAADGSYTYTRDAGTPGNV
ncbi:Ig-like domain-containing protein, partial [Pseudochelatococcus lubricantis]|uniref:Ig-like domain-containing protein n=1 Tax=Pseudochelatococcus lubricantis TaxID=1538102 RepID=UPI0035EB2A73